jgi:agmatinase
VGHRRERLGFLRVNDFRNVTGPLTGLPWGAPHNFLGLPAEHCDFESSAVALLPVPYEATVSWMSGTRRGPGALIDASHHLELYDHELDAEPFRIGIHTLPELLLPASGPGAALDVLREGMEGLLERGKFVIVLGGEHSLSCPPILAHADRLGNERLTVLQLDAHCDLRSEYDGTGHSHASVMHRVMDRADVVPVGIRSMTADERALVRQRRIPILFSHELESDGWIDRALECLGERVYITFDIDYFDPGIMPSTGTPEPGGGRWHPTLALLERVFRERTVVGCDVVELSPIPGLVAPDFLAAKLVYKMIGLHAQTRGNRQP